MEPTSQSEGKNVMSKFLVVIPTYNEIENIAAIIEAVLGLPLGAQLLIVDDSSPDGTGLRVEELKGQYGGRLHLLSRQGKQGLGTAYIAGFRWGLEEGFDYLSEMDADFSHDPQDLTRLLEACEQRADVAIGSRYKNGFRVKDWPLSRILISYCASIYVRLVTWMPIFDTTAGFVCYKASALQALLAQPIEMKGYGFQIEMKYLAYRLGFKLVEVPILFTDRQRGKSKMSGGIFSEALLGVIKLRWRARKVRKVARP